MRKVAGKGNKRRVLIIVGVAIVVLAITQMVVLGLLGGIGPLKFLKENKVAKHEGNAEEYHLENVTSSENSPLAGKSILFLGSSVTYGASSLSVSMADYIGVLDNCRITKEAVSGTTLADKNSSSYVSRLKEVDTEADFDAIVVQLSTNDATKKVALGAVSDSKNIDDFDSSTVIGAMETIICYAQETWDCPVIFYTGTKYNSDEYQEMVDALLQLQEKWDIGVIDLWNDADMNAVSEEEYALYMYDGIHPTQAGYLKWWTPKFQEYLYNYL